MFTIALPNQQVKTYSRLNDATKFADKTATEQGIELEVVNSETEAVAYLTSPAAIAKRDEGRHFTPWTRLETPKFTAPDIEGFYPAYTRKRITATVYRAYDPEAELPWLVHDGRTGHALMVRNTKEACALTREMRQGRML